MTFWGVAPYLLSGTALLLVVAAVWPPVHFRRLASALLLFVAAGLIVSATSWASFRLPTRVVVVAECTVYHHPNFASMIASARREASHLDLLVLGETKDMACSEMPSTPAQSRTVVPTLAAGMAAADQQLSTEPLLWSWRARRIVLYGRPGGPIEEAQPIGDADRKAYLEILERHRAEVEYRPYGEPLGMKVSAPLWRSTDAAGTLALQLDITDPQLERLQEVRYELEELSLDENCNLQLEKRMGSGAGSGVSVPVSDIAKVSDNRRLIRIGFQGGLYDSALRGQCGNGSWSRINAKAYVRLDDGGMMEFRGSAIQGRSAPTAITLVTPPAGSMADRRAAVGWEDNGSQVLSNDGPGISEIITDLSADLRSSGARERFTRWPLAAFWRTLETDCWFPGVTTLSDPVISDKFEKCLRRTGRLALIAPTEADIATLEAKYRVGSLVTDGSLHTLVAIPAYEKASSVGPSTWAAIDSRQEAVTTRPIIFFSPTRNSLLTRGEYLSEQRQGAIFSSLFKTPRAGIAGAGLTCNAAAKIDASLNRPNLIWFHDTASPVPPPPPARGDEPVLQLRESGAARYWTSPSPELPNAFAPGEGERYGTKDKFRTNLLCNHPLKRLTDVIEEFKSSGLLRPGRSLLPRTSIVLTEINQRFPPIAAIAGAGCEVTASPIYSESRIRQNLTDFLEARGSIVIQPLDSHLAYDGALIDEAVQHIGGTALSLQQLMLDVASGRSANSIRLLRPFPQSANSSVISASIMSALDSLWAVEQRAQTLYSFAADDGYLVDRRDRCLADTAASDVAAHCAFMPRASLSFTPLNRLQSTPGLYQELDAPREWMTSGDVRMRSGASIQLSKPVGMGWSHFLGFSPLGPRDFGLATQLEPDSTRQRQSLCTLYSDGTNAKVEHRRPVPFGGISMLDRFARPQQAVPGEPQVDAIELDEKSTMGAFTIVLNAAVGGNGGWNWLLRLADARGVPFAGESPASLIFKSFDPRTGEARVRVEPRKKYEGGLTISFTDQESAPSSIMLPAQFESFSRALSLTDAIDELSLARSESTTLTLDTSAAFVLALLLISILLFSPIARSWRAPVEAFHARFGKRLFSAGLRSPAATFFSLQAALAEFGMHPGQAVASRNAGLPAGVRVWRSGDSGRAMIFSSLYPLLGQNSPIPAMKPKVRLRTASEALSALVLVDGTGALLSPPSVKSPSKADFAGALAAFFAGAITLAYGRADIKRAGLADTIAREGNEAALAVREALEAPVSFVSPESELQKGESYRLVFYVCDGLSVNGSELSRTAELMAAEGTTLRVAAIISRDDERAAMLRRDPRSGIFEDDSETHPATFIAARDRRIAKAKVDLSRRGGAMIVPFDTHLSTQEVLQIVNDTGFLR